MRRDSANKNAEFSPLVSAMGCPLERSVFINIYHCLQIDVLRNIILKMQKF